MGDIADRQENYRWFKNYLAELVREDLQSRHPFLTPDGSLSAGAGDIVVKPDGTLVYDPENDAPVYVQIVAGLPR